MSILGLLDADVRFRPDYFERLMAKFPEDPRLGLAGGLVYDIADGAPGRARQNLEEVAGAAQFFRRECFESLGGLVAIPEGGWDAITGVCARMKGYKTRTFPELLVEHLKPRNSAFGHPLQGKWQLGMRDHALASRPMFELLKCCARITERPFFLGSLARMAGYAWARLSKRPIVVPQNLVSQIRHEQGLRVRSVFRRRDESPRGKDAVVS